MIADFTGMQPIRDPLLLPDSNAQYSENTWLYRGTIRGFRHALSVHDIKYSDTRSVYRIPTITDIIPDFLPSGSVWLEFPDPYMHVIRSPTSQDEFNRYYFFPSDQYRVTDPSPNPTPNPNWPSTNPGPMYNTLDRIQANQSPFILGIPDPANAPGVTPSQFSFDLTATAATLPGDIVLYFADTSNVKTGMTVFDTTDTTTTAIADLPSGVGATLINFNSTVGIYVGMTVTSPTNASAILFGTTVTNMNSTQTWLSNLVQSPGITAGDTIKFENKNVIIANTSVKTFTSTTVTISTGVLAAGVLPGDVINFYTTPETRAYVYTYVSAYNEEGPPSPPTVVQGGFTGTWTITVTCPDATQMANRNLNRVRIYRTVTDTAGNTSYYQVAELTITSPSAVLTYADSKEDAEITANNPLSTVDYTGPPSDLQGVVMMANGIAAGWSSEREVWFSAQYYPHAWPGSFSLAVDYPVVGLTPNGSSLNIITEGPPSIATGTTPDTMTIAKVVANEPGISRGGITASPEGAFYPSPNGYQLLNTSGVQNLTMNLLEKEFWFTLDPYDFASATYGSTIVTFIKGNGITSVGENNTENGIVIDTSIKNVPFSYIKTIGPILNCYIDELSGQIFYLTSSQGSSGHGQVMQWHPPIGTPGQTNLWSYIWKTKRFRFTSPQTFKAFMVLFEIPPEVNITLGPRNTDQNQVYNQATQLLIVRIYGDGLQLVVREIQKSGEVILIPDKNKYTFFEAQLEGQVVVTFFKVASSVKELRAT